MGADLTPLGQSFFLRRPHVLARRLLGKYLARTRASGEVLLARIVEVEVYGGQIDPASHANSGKPTRRTEAMFGEPGTWYVYKIYGLYHCLNLVAPSAERPSAVLIRAAEPLRGQRLMAKRRGLKDVDEQPLSERARMNLLSGPGKLCQAFSVDLSFNKSSAQSTRLRLLHAPHGQPLSPSSIDATPRIGLNPRTVGDAVHWPWRYLIRESPYLSR